MVDFIFPPACIACGRDISFTSALGFCRICYHNLPRINNSCIKCGRFTASPETRICRLCSCSKRFFSFGVSALVFASPVREVLFRMKYGHEIYQARYLGSLMAKSWKKSGHALPECVTYVPLMPLKHKQRGFNQSRLLAAETAKRLKIPVKPFLKRLHEDVSQASLKLDKRPANIRGCFSALTSKRCDYNHVLIVDDVMTSGSTLNECSKELLSTGINQVSVLTLMSVED